MSRRRPRAPPPGQSAVESAASEATGAAEAGSSAAAPTGGNFKVVSDLPMQGASGAQSKTLVQAMQLYLEQQGGAAGDYAIEFEAKDDSTAAAAKWDPTTCSANAQAYAGDDSILGVIGTFNSGCAKLEVPILNQAGVAMLSPANTAVGLTHVGPARVGRARQLLPDGKRNYARVVPSDDFQGAAAARMAGAGVKSVLHPERQGGLREGRRRRHRSRAAEKLGITVLANEGYDPKAPNYDALFEQIKGENPDRRVHRRDHRQQRRPARQGQGQGPGDNTASS